MLSGHSTMEKSPSPAADPSVHRPGKGNEKVAKMKKKKRRRRSSSSARGGSGDNLEANGIAHPQQHPTTTPAPASSATTGGVPSTVASVRSDRLDAQAPRSRRNSEDVVGSPKAPSMDGGNIAGSLNNHSNDFGTKAPAPNHHHHHHDNDNDINEQDVGVVLQRDTLSASAPAAKKGKGKHKKEKDERHNKNHLTSPSVANGDAPATTTTSSLAGDSSDCYSGGKKERELARSRRKRTAQETDGSEESHLGIPFALPTQASRANTPSKAHSHRRSLGLPEGSHPRGTPNNAGGGGPKATSKGGGAQSLTGGGGVGTLVGAGVAASLGRKRPRDAGGGGGGGGGGGASGGGGGGGSGGGGDGAEAVSPSPGFVAQGRLPRKHLEQRKGLPIFSHKADIIRAVKGHQTVVIVGETGSGKSTQIPQFLYEAGITGGGAGWAGSGQAG